MASWPLAVNSGDVVEADHHNGLLDNAARKAVSLQGQNFYTPGSVLFADGSGFVDEDNSELFWDDTNKRLGIGTVAPVNPFHVAQTGTVVVKIESTDNVAAQLVLKASGVATRRVVATDSSDVVQAQIVFADTGAMTFAGTSSSSNIRATISTSGDVAAIGDIGSGGDVILLEAVTNPTGIVRWEKSGSAFTVGIASNFNSVTADALEFLTSSNITSMMVDNSGVLIGNAGVVGNLDGTLAVYDATATTGTTKIAIRAGAGQSTDKLLEIQNNAGTVVTNFSADGTLVIGGSFATGNVIDCIGT